MMRTAFLLLICSAALGAQATGPQGEIRAEAYATGALLGGLGFVLPLGTYARVGLVGAAGRYVDQPSRTAARVDALMRFHLDPLRQHRRALYAAAGVSASRDQDTKWRPYVLARIGMELTSRGRWIPAVEIGLGGGGHIGLVVRPARKHWR